MMDAELREWTRGAVLGLDDKLTETDPSFMTASVLLAACRVGANPKAIADALDYEPEFVRGIGSRLRNARIWIGDKVSKRHFDSWTHEDHGGAAFWMDVNVADGLMIIKGTGGDGQSQYGMSLAGIRHVKGMVARNRA